MLKKLRLKMILFSMLIVTIMLGVIFGLMYISTSRSLERESMRMMERIAMNPRQPAPPGIPQENVHLPYFSVRLDSNGEISGTSGGFFDLSDTELLNGLTDACLARQEKSGILREYRLRYSRFDTPSGECIVFADMSSEQSTLRNMLRTFSIIGAAAYLVFFGISVILARGAVKPVEQAWAQQKQFVADASHELKTPLTVIMTNAELLSSSCQDADGKLYSENILTMSEQMRGLVESLLELARIDNGSRSAAYCRLSLSDEVSAAAMMFEPVFFERDMPFRYEIEPDIFIRGDAVQLRQLAEIFLDNASKYASPGGETVLRLKIISHRHCLLEAVNQGEEIGPQELNDLFKRFYRADKARSMNHSYGLGLSIAKSICAEHGGKISASSRDGWNVFSAELPVEPK